MITYITLNRTIGATKKRHIDGPYEVILPIKTKDGFKAPNNIKDYFAGFAFKKYLEQGETVLINRNGGWNTLSKDDKIVSIYKK